MILDLSQTKQLNKFKERSDYLIKNQKRVNLTEVKDTITTLQNAALHLYFTMISQELNELGMEFRYDGLTHDSLSLRYTPHIIKEFIWRPIQVALFDIRSTTKINTIQINEITDVLGKYFAEKGVLMEFPSINSLMNR